MRWLSVVLLSAAFLGVCHGAKILAIFPFISKSHYILGDALLKGLVQKGHSVTMISGFKSEKQIKNYTEVPIEGLIEFNELHASRMTSANTSFLEAVKQGFEMFPGLFNLIHTHKNIKEFVQKKEKYDVCIVSLMAMESMFTMCNIVQAPSIAFFTAGLNSLISYHTNNPLPLSYVPSPLLSASPQMSFKERVQNVLVTNLFDAVYHFLLMPYQQVVLDRYYPNSPKMEELMDNVDLYLINSHFSTESPKPLLPNIIPIGGFHLQIMDEIPADIKQYLDQSKHGVIYFNLGSNTKSANLEPHIIEALLSTFAKLKYDVLWKFEGDLPNKPKNVFIAKWLPQRPILMHPKIKLFMTHGGLGGTVESIYGGVPMICMPVFADQGKNCAEGTQNGYAITINLKEITAEKLTNAINEITTNPSYKEKTMLRSDLYRNQEINPMDKAIFWIEHVIRHKGAKHLKSRATSIPWYQYYLLDVISFLSGILILIVMLIYFVIKLNLRLLCWAIRKIFRGKKNDQPGKQKIKKQ